MNDIERAYTQHAKDVYRFLLSLTHNEDLAEELTHHFLLILTVCLWNYVLPWL